MCFCQAFSPSTKCPVICDDDELPPECGQTGTDCNYYACVDNRCAAVVSRHTVNVVRTSTCAFDEVGIAHVPCGCAVLWAGLALFAVGYG